MRTQLVGRQAGEEIAEVAASSGNVGEDRLEDLLVGHLLWPEEEIVHCPELPQEDAGRAFRPDQGFSRAHPWIGAHSADRLQLGEDEVKVRPHAPEAVFECDAMDLLGELFLAAHDLIIELRTVVEATDAG